MQSSDSSCSGAIRSPIPYSEAEAQEAWLFVNRFGPSNAWTGTGGTAARIIGRLLRERERLLTIITPQPETTRDDRTESNGSER